MCESRCDTLPSSAANQGDNTAQGIPTLDGYLMQNPVYILYMILSSL